MFALSPRQESLLVNALLVALGILLIFLGGPRFGSDFGDGATSGAGFMLLGAGANGLVTLAKSNGQVGPAG